MFIHGKGKKTSNNNNNNHNNDHDKKEKLTIPKTDNKKHEDLKKNYNNNKQKIKTISTN